MTILRLTPAQEKALDSILVQAMDDALSRMEMYVEDGKMSEAQEALRERNHAHQLRYNLGVAIREQNS